MLDLLGGGGYRRWLTPLFCVSTPPHKISQKYIEDPLWFYHKSSTEGENDPRKYSEQRAYRYMQSNE